LVGGGGVGAEVLLTPPRLDAEMLGSARDAYADVVFGAISAEAFAGRWLPGGRADDRRILQSLLEAQRWRLAMFASDAWFWEDPARTETAQVLRAAARAVRIVDGLAETHLERRLVDDLSLLTSPSRGLSGTELYRESLAAVGQPAPS
jgi:hypothetical protein